MRKIRWPQLVRRIHKWLALLIGVQVIFWTATGFYMVVVHIDTIHGDHLVRPPAAPGVIVADLSSPAAAAAAVPGASEVRLISRIGQPAWRVQGEGGVATFDARTGARHGELSEAEARAAAKARFAGVAEIVRAVRLTKPVQEMGRHAPPYWQVEFAGWNQPTLYVAPQTGELLARRHQLWRIFDFAWMLHIMDYRDRSDVNNPLLRVATWTALAMALTGAWLLVWAFPRRKKRKSV